MLTGGAIAGIIIGILVALSIIPLVLFLRRRTLLRNKRLSRQTLDPFPAPSFTQPPANPRFEAIIRWQSNHPVSAGYPVSINPPTEAPTDYQESDIGYPAAHRQDPWNNKGHMS